MSFGRASVSERELREHRVGFCPFCNLYYPIEALLNHVKAHGVDFHFKGKRVVVSVQPLQAYEYGTPFKEWGRVQIPEEKWETEKIYNGEGNGFLADEAGNPVTIAKPMEFIYETVRQLRYQGLDCQYMRVEGAYFKVQAYGSPAPWYAYLIALALIAAVIYVFGTTFKSVMESLWRIFVAPIPPEWRPYVYLAVLAIVGTVVAAYAYGKFKKG